MKKIDAYIFKKYLGTFFFAISMLILVVIIFDVSENIDSFLKHNAPWQKVVVDYYIMSIPYYINLFIHLFAFIAVVFFTSKMAARTEIVAILSSGISFWRFLYPYMLAAISIGIMSLYFGNFLIPKTNEIRRQFKDEYMEKLSQSAGRNVHVQIGKDEFVYVESYNIVRQHGYKFSWEKYEDNELKFKVMSDMLYHDTVAINSWNIDPYAIRNINGREETLTKGRNLDTLLNLYPTDLYKMKEDFEEMNYFELREHILSMKEKGSEGVKAYEVEMHTRMSAPAAVLILTLIGAALSSRKIRGGIGMHLGIGITIAFAYILFMQVSKSFAISGSLSPFLAAWIPNFIFCMLGIYLLIKAPK
ncbi:MAG: LptF/LptG family permease [Bacteroidales bacterium]|jgi:lipopolysaccharide export system permease protein|nr:LptF/LptG family permease [Bacteroidales bacterium]MBR6930193.1 LptF/LptG family permease [Bacteroidales bacterium]